MVTWDEQQRGRGWFRLAGALGVVLAVGLVAGCGGTAGKSGHVDVSAANLSPWPFTVSSGVIACDNGAVTFTAGGKKYALNGSAQANGLSPIDAVWAMDPSHPSLNVSVDGAIKKGLALCGQ